MARFEAILNSIGGKNKVITRIDQLEGRDLELDLDHRG